MQQENPKIFLEGDNIYLRAFEREDLKGEYRKWINDPEVTRYLQVGTLPQNDDELLDYYERSLVSKNEVFFAVIEKASARHIGNAQLYDISWIHRSAMRGILIGDKDCWGKGYGLEIIQLLNSYGFDTLNLNKIISSTIADNTAVQKLNLKAGYTKEGIGRREFYRKGKYYDRVYWGMLQSEYVAQKN